MSEHKPSAHETVRATIKETSKQQAGELRRLVQREKMSVAELEAMQIALGELRRAAETPEGLALFCQEQVLGIDAEALQAQGFYLNEKESKRAKTAAAKKVQKTIRKLLDKILHHSGPLSETKQEAVVREEYERQGMPGVERIMSTHDEAVQKIERLPLSAEQRASFIGRALEARRKALAEASAIASPEARLQASVEELTDKLEALSEAILLSATSTSESPVLGGTTIDGLARVSDSVMAHILDNPNFQRIEASVRRELEPVYNAAMELSVPERLVAAAALATVATGVVMAPTLLTSGAPLPVEVAGMYVTASYAAGAAAGITLVGGETLRTQFYGEIRKELEKYERAVASVTKKPVSAPERVSTKVAAKAEDANADIAEARARARRAASAQGAHRTM